MNNPTVIIAKYAAYPAKLYSREWKIIKLFSSPGLTSHPISCQILQCWCRAGVLWVELILCNSWQAWIRKMGYIEITMKIMMSDSHNLCGELVTPQHGLNKYFTTKQHLWSANIRLADRLYWILSTAGELVQWVVQWYNAMVQWYITYNWSTGDDPTVSQVSAVCSVGWLCPGWLTPTLQHLTASLTGEQSAVV